MYSAASCIINNIRLVSVARQGIGRNRYACCGVSDISGTGFAKDSDFFDVSFSGRNPFPSFYRFTGNVLVKYTNILRYRVRSLCTDRDMLAFNRGTGFTKGLCVCGSLYSGTEALFPFLRFFSRLCADRFPVSRVLFHFPVFLFVVKIKAVLKVTASRGVFADGRERFPGIPSFQRVFVLVSVVRSLF